MIRDIIDSNPSPNNIARRVDPNQPIVIIYDSIFVYAFDNDVLEFLKGYLPTVDFGNITLLLLDRYEDVNKLKDPIINLIKYGIFKNQDLCERLFISTCSDEQYELVNSIWPEQQKAITKFSGRKWPQEDFLVDFQPIEGSGAVAPKEVDPKNLVSWFFEIEFSEKETKEVSSIGTVPDPEPGEEEIPGLDTDDPHYKDYILKTITDDEGIKKFDEAHINELIESSHEKIPITIPEYKEDDAQYEYGYSIIYYFKNEYTKFPITESLAKPMNNLTTSHTKPLNEITVHMKRLWKIEMVEYETAKAAGGEGTGS